jgi:endonuclease YncB( thermonuclease family)
MSTTWSAIGSRSVKAVCTTANEAAPSAPAAASGTATCASVIAGDKLTVAGRAFTAVAASPGEFQFLVGADDAACAASLAIAITQQRDLIGVSAVAASAVVTITATSVGIAGNAITLAQTGDTITVSGEALTGGVSPVGVLLDGVAHLQIIAVADATRTITDGDGFKAYLYDPLIGLYVDVSNVTMTVPTGSRTGMGGAAGILGITIHGKAGQYLAYVPTAMTVSAGGLTVYHFAYTATGKAL